MPRKVAKIKDVGVDKEKSVVKKDVVKKDGVKRGRKMRGGGKLLQHIITALENNNLVYDELIDNINDEFDKIKEALVKKRATIISKLIKNDAKNTHDNHINQIKKFKLKDIKDIPSLLDLKNLLEYIKNIDGYNNIDIKILYTNIIILYIYNFFELIKDIIENNAAAADIEVKDTPATPATPATAAITAVASAVSSPVIETDDAIIKSMEVIYNTNREHFIVIDKEIINIYKNFKYMLEFIITLPNMGSYNDYDIKNYLLNRKPSILNILNEKIPNIEDFIKKIKNTTSSKLFNMIYLDNLLKEIEKIKGLCNEWIIVINKATK